MASSSSSSSSSSSGAQADDERVVAALLSRPDRLTAGPRLDKLEYDVMRLLRNPAASLQGSFSAAVPVPEVRGGGAAAAGRRPGENASDNNEEDAMVVDALVPFSEMPPGNTVESVLRTSRVSLPRTGWTFSTSAPPPDSGDAVYALCRLAVGRSHVVSDAEIAQNAVLPPGCSSFRVRGPERDPEPVRFLVLDSDRVVPCFVVVVDNGRRQVGMCGNCSRRSAVVFCESDSALLCKECDTAVHSANRVVARHVRTPVAGHGGAGDPACPDHRDQPLTHYCDDCKEPVCVSCKMEGSHARGEKSQHTLTKIGEAFKDATDFFERMVQHDLEAPHMQRLLAELAACESRMRELADNEEAVRAQIFERAQSASEELRRRTEERTSATLARALELSRQHTDIEWRRRILQGLRATGQPVRFLRAFRVFQECEMDPAHRMAFGLVGSGACAGTGLIGDAASDGTSDRLVLSGSLAVVTEAELQTQRDAETRRLVMDRGPPAGCGWPEATRGRSVSGGGCAGEGEFAGADDGMFGASSPMGRSGEGAGRRGSRGTPPRRSTAAGRDAVATAAMAAAAFHTGAAGGRSSQTAGMYDGGSKASARGSLGSPVSWSGFQHAQLQDTGSSPAAAAVTSSADTSAHLSRPAAAHFRGSAHRSRAGFLRNSFDPDDE